MMQKKETTSKQGAIQTPDLCETQGNLAVNLREDLGVDLIIAFRPVQTNLDTFVYLP